MTWSKLCDSMHSHPKVRSVETREPAALALHMLALSYAGHYLTDGRIDAGFVVMHESLMKRKRLAEVLVDAGLWESAGDEYIIHDYLSFNPSRVSVEARRTKDLERKEQARSIKESKQSPQRFHEDSARKPQGSRKDSALPDPTRPDPSRSHKEESNIDSLTLVARDTRQLGRESDDSTVHIGLEGVV